MVDIMYHFSINCLNFRYNSNNSSNNNNNIPFRKYSDSTNNNSNSNIIPAVAVTTNNTNKNTTTTTTTNNTAAGGNDSLNIGLSKSMDVKSFLRPGGMNRIMSERLVNYFFCFAVKIFHGHVY